MLNRTTLVRSESAVMYSLQLVKNNGQETFELKPHEAPAVLRCSMEWHRTIYLDSHMSAPVPFLPMGKKKKMITTILRRISYMQHLAWIIAMAHACCFGSLGRYTGNSLRYLRAWMLALHTQHTNLRTHIHVYVLYLYK